MENIFGWNAIFPNDNTKGGARLIIVEGSVGRDKASVSSEGTGMVGRADFSRVRFLRALVKLKHHFVRGHALNLQQETGLHDYL